MHYRAIKPQDQQVLADGIWQVYETFDCVGPGYGPQDPDMDDLHAFYNQEGAYYLVATDDAGQVVGGCGFAAFGPASAATCELRKFYLLPSARGSGAGREILQRTLDQAKQMGYRQCYLETVERMEAAVALYEKFGFQKLKEAMFGGGHHVCESKYLKVLSMLLLCLGTWFLPSCSSSLTVPPATEAVQSPELREELIMMHMLNQELRDELIRIGLNRLSLKDIYRQESLDRMHSSRLKEILAYHGWPGKDLVGSDGAEAAFHLAEHSHREPQFMGECLKLMGKAMERGQVNPAHYAELYDRVQVTSGLRQRFGTQARVVEGKLQFYPLEDPQRVDSRRAQMGLVPLAEYRRTLERAYRLEAKSNSSNLER